MTDKQIACFLEVSRCLSFSKAAQNLFMTQPGVTHQIAALESELGFALFNRGYRSITLTPAGERFYKAMEKINAQIQEAISQARALKEQHGNFLTIGHYSPEGDHQFYQAVQAFTGDHESYSIDIRLPPAGMLCEHLLQRKLDAVIVPQDALPPSEEICFAPLFSNPEYCIMSRTHPLAGLSGITLSDLHGAICMLHADVQGEVLPWHEQQIRLRRDRYDLRDGHTMREMITNIRSQPCVMFSLYPLLFISDDLVRIPFTDGPQNQTVLAWRCGSDKPALQALCDFLPAFYAE